MRPRGMGEVYRATDTKLGREVVPDGKVKVLDFGLANAWAGDAAEGKAPSL